LDTISYSWSVKEQPTGANAVISNPNARSTSVSGLTAPGEYGFIVSASDGSDVVSRDVRLTVFSDNQPPLPDDVHNRIPVTLTLPNSSTQLRGYGWDLEGDPLSYRWSTLSQPAGAKVSLTNTTTTNCTASSMTVPGDYVFRFEVSEPSHTVSRELTVPVYPENPSAPFIKSAIASPPSLTLPATSRTDLSATTGDRDGDLISHWWSVRSAPTGARPVFAAPGSPQTDVTCLTVPGTYVFTLTVVDRTKHTTKDVTVTVAGSPSPPTVAAFAMEADDTLTLAWTDFASVYTVEEATGLAGHDWQAVSPADQWPIPTTSWAGSDLAGQGTLFYRIRGE
jgi:hypothetical protein